MALVPQGEHRLIRIKVSRSLRTWSHFLCYNGVLQAVFVRDEASCDNPFFDRLRRPVSGLGSLELVSAQLDTRFGKVTKYYSSTILIWPRYYLTYAFAVRLFLTWLVRRSFSTLARLASSTLLNSRQGWRRLICQAFAIGAIGGLLSFALLVASSLKRHTIS